MRFLSYIDDAGLDIKESTAYMISDTKWSMRIYHKPLIRFIWIGALMMVLGGFLSILSKKINYKGVQL